MKGRRIPVPASGDANEVTWNMEPGDYSGPYVGYTGDCSAVFYVLPGGQDVNARGISHVTSPPHTFRECADGSLEIRESILHLGPHGEHLWHGYLDEGHNWRVV